jgi:hypothetical protein
VTLKCVVPTLSEAASVVQQGLNWPLDEFAERYGVQSPPPRRSARPLIEGCNLSLGDIVFRPLRLSSSDRV